MTTNPASFLSVQNQTYDPVTQRTTATFSWIKGFGSAGETLNQQTVVVSETSNVNCNQPGVVCANVGNTATSLSLGNLLPNHVYSWTIQSFFSSGGNPYYIPILNFTTLGSSPIPSLAPNPVGRFPASASHHAIKPLPDFPFTTVHAGLSPISFRPAVGQSGGSGGNPPVGATTLNTNINYCWQYSGTPGPAVNRTGDGLAMIIAIMLAESGGHADACSRDIISGCTNYELCSGNPNNGWTPAAGQQANGWGLFQMNVCGGQGVGHNRDYWLNPQNNAQAAIQPYILNAINSNGGMTTVNYTDAQIMNICIASGHPGGNASDVNTIAGFNNIKGMYNRVKFQIRVTNFPLNSAGDFQY